MKYFLIILIFFIGCENKTQNHQNKKVYIEDILPQKKANNTKKTEIKIDNLTFIEDNNNLIYNFDKNQILIFTKKNKFSKLQLEELNKSNQKFYVIHNKKLEKFFKIKQYPTIIITKSNNNIKKYEGFIPNEILQYEIKD